MPHFLNEKSKFICKVYRKLIRINPKNLKGIHPIVNFFKIYKSFLVNLIP